MENITLRYGQNSVNLAFNGAQSITYLEPNAQPAIADLAFTLAESVEKPIASPALSSLLVPQDLITIVVSDITRLWSRQDLVCQELVKFLHDKCRIPLANIVVLIALGTHREQTEKELRANVSDWVYDHIQVKCHNYLGEVVHVGTTSFGTPVWVNPLAMGRKVIVVGSTVHHLMSGYGGGRKNILPGICGKKTILANHMMCLHPEQPCSSELIGMSRLEGNPVHADMDEAAALVNPVFGINILVNKDGKQCRLMCGHWKSAWEQSCKAINDIAGVGISQKADIVVASCGGYPKDINLYQGVKTLLNMGEAIKPGGTLVFIAQCPEGGGAPDFFDWSKSLKTNSLDADLRAGFTIAGYIFYAACEIMKKARVLMLTELDPEVLADMNIEGHTTMESLLKAVDFTNKDVIVMPYGGSTVPFVKS